MCECAVLTEHKSILTAELACAESRLPRSYMDYSNDACMTTFTPDQASRMTVRALSHCMTTGYLANGYLVVVVVRCMHDFKAVRQLHICSGRPDC